MDDVVQGGTTDVDVDERKKEIQKLRRFEKTSIYEEVICPDDATDERCKIRMAVEVGDCFAIVTFLSIRIAQEDTIAKLYAALIRLAEEHHLTELLIDCHKVQTAADCVRPKLKDLFREMKTKQCKLILERAHKIRR